MQMTRRKALIFGSACVCCGARSASSWPGDQTDNRNLPSGGCYLLPEQAASRANNRSMFSAMEESYSTGDQDLDRKLGRALARAAQFFAINPAFGFYHEMNAQASDEVSANIPRTWGTVLFGMPLFKQELTVHDRSGMTILSIIAHEFGHIVQFKKRARERMLVGQSTVKRLELHADILAGFFLGARKRENPQLSFYTAGEVFHRIGDHNFNSQNHHGTPDERAAASNLGFQHGTNGSTDLDQLFQIGVNYVMRL
jgi:hypothetical protein